MLKWTQAARDTHFLWFPVPASASMPVFLFILNIAWWTFFLSIATAVVLGILRANGRTGFWVFRRLRARLGGGVIHARSVWYRRRMQRSHGFDLVDLEKVRKPI